MVPFLCTGEKKMTKTLLLNTGFGWCGTTPYYRTLTKAKYCENGNKEPHLLQRVFEGHTDISEYISYHNSLPGERVTDFSNTNADLPEEFIDEIAPILLKNFDIKVTMIFRDPVRRLYSLCNHLYQTRTLRHRMHGTSIQYFRYKLKQPIASYVRTYRMYSKWFPTYTIIMEDLWKNPEKELPKLSEFLEYPVENLHPNVYHDGIMHKKLQDQWTDKIPLSTVAYMMARKELEYLFNEWLSEFGNIPSSWC